MDIQTTYIHPHNEVTPHHYTNNIVHFETDNNNNNNKKPDEVKEEEEKENIKERKNINIKLQVQPQQEQQEQEKMIKDELTSLSPSLYLSLRHKRKSSPAVLGLLNEENETKLTVHLSQHRNSIEAAMLLANFNRPQIKSTPKLEKK
ncbi:hypothetical protein BJ944DRAFT_292223 [Cunninghamella echinulata]|nr:hypothetical protein BJ944DRAFT_292223 [Cunninghamella echinulata]